MTTLHPLVDATPGPRPRRSGAADGGRSPACFGFGWSVGATPACTTGDVNTALPANEAPHRRQNFRAGSLPSPHWPQTRSPGLTTRSGRPSSGVWVGFSCSGLTASGCTGPAPWPPMCPVGPGLSRCRLRRARRRSWHRHGGLGRRWTGRSRSSRRRRRRRRRARSARRWAARRWRGAAVGGAAVGGAAAAATGAASVPQMPGQAPAGDERRRHGGPSQVRRRSAAEPRAAGAGPAPDSRRVQAEGAHWPPQG